MTSSNSIRIDPRTGRIIEVTKSGLSTTRSFKGEDITSSEGCDRSSLSAGTDLEADSKLAVNSDPTSREIKSVVKEPQFIAKRKICLSLTNTTLKRNRPSLDHRRHLQDDSLTEEGLPFSLQDWKNPVIGAPENAALQLRLENSLNSRMKKFFKVNSLFSFDKRSLEHIELLGQIDKKFMACVTSLQRKHTLQTCNSDDNECKTETFSKVLILFDQHAAHERVRLERLQYHFLTGYDLPLGEGRKSITAVTTIARSTLNPVIILSKHIDTINTRRLKDHLEDFENIGISLVLRFASSDTVLLTVRSLPRLFVKINPSNSLEKTSLLDNNTVFELLNDHLNFLTTKSSFCPRIPPAIGKVLNSLACHGAIRFGDSLTRKDMEMLLKQLTQCDLPFQCAHGRPSVVPLFNISLLGESCAARYSRPQLIKLLGDKKLS